ncbi:hypothetical protein V8C37DRAFT_375507 [Trichoderma ceciliae]
MQGDARQGLRGYFLCSKTSMWWLVGLFLGGLMEVCVCVCVCRGVLLRCCSWSIDARAGIRTSSCSSIAMESIWYIERRYRDDMDDVYVVVGGGGI